MFHVGSCRGGGACAQLVLVPVSGMYGVTGVSGMYAFAHKTLH